MNRSGKYIGAFVFSITKLHVGICILKESEQLLEADIVLVSSSKRRPYVLLPFCSMPSTPQHGE